MSMPNSVTGIDRPLRRGAPTLPPRHSQPHSPPENYFRTDRTVRRETVGPDTERLKPHPNATGARPQPSKAHRSLLERAEDIVHYVVAGILMAVAIYMLIDTMRTLTVSMTKASFPAAATNAVNGVLFAVIIVEITRTVLSHFDNKGLQLQPFLIIGIVSAVRGVLSVGARLSLNDMGAKQVDTSLLELGINAAVVLGLAASLVLIRRYGSSPATEGATPAGGSDAILPGTFLQT